MICHSEAAFDVPTRDFVLMLTLMLSPNSGSYQIIAQYYQLIRLGFEVITEITLNTTLFL